MMKDSYFDRMEYCLGKDNFVYDLSDKKWYSYAQIWKNAQNYAKAFKDESLDEVAAVLENGIELFIIYFACMIANVKVVPVDPQKSEVEINNILVNHPGIKVIRDKNDLPALTDEEAEVKEIKILLQAVDYEKTYMVTYTSGSTGQAKGVMHSLGNLFAAAVAFGEKTGFGKQSRVCHTMPMTYMAGILNTIFMPFIMNSSIVLFPRFSVMTAVTFWRNVRKTEVNTFWLSPTMLNILLTVDRRGDIAEYFEHIDSTFCIGTAPLFLPLREKFESRYHVKLLQSYGLSETLFISTETKESVHSEASVGEVLQDVDLQFAEDGEIWINVPWMYAGYTNESNEPYFHEKYYKSGDLGTVENNKLYITGRKKDLIIRGGMNISPKQIEDVLMETQRVRECAVASLTKNSEEYIICWYVKQSSDDEIDALLSSTVIERLGKAYRVDEFVQMREIPKNLNGKVDKQKLKEEYNHDIEI